MQRIAVFADIHSDLASLQSILSAVEELGISRAWCLGDFLGSGGREPVECFDLVMDCCEPGRMLAGNHEEFITSEIFRTLAGGWADVAYAAAMALGPDRRGRLAKLKSHVLIPELGVELVHGALGSEEDNTFGFISSAGRQLKPSSSLRSELCSTATRTSRRAGGPCPEGLWYRRPYARASTCSCSTAPLTS